MGNYEFRSDKLNYREPLPKIEEINKESQEKPLNVPIESKTKPIVTKETTVRLRVRKSPNGEILKVLDKGTKVEIDKEQSDGWTKLLDGTYVMSKFLK